MICITFPCLHFHVVELGLVLYVVRLSTGFHLQIVVLFLLLNFIRCGGLGGWGVSVEVKRELSKVFLPSAMWVLGIQLRVPHLTAAPLPTKLPHQYLLFLILIFLL